jgi:thioredoxin-like negative regulator of GroEL
MQSCGSLFGECDVRIELAVTLHLAGERDEALDHLREALDIAERLNIDPQRARTLDVLAGILDTTDPDTANTYRARADAIYQRLDLPRPPTAPTLER